MSRAAVLRADVELAPARVYPERAEHEPQWHDRVADWLTSRIARPVLRRIADPSRRLARIILHAAACEREFAAAADEALRLAALDLRRSLRREGFRIEHAGRTFALVREVAHRRLGQRHFDVQLIGGWGLLQGKLVEMATGEGKTLTATLPACTAALAGVPVHVITVNDYLAKRDAEDMGPIYTFLGLSVGVVTHEMTPDQRRAAYGCDITYCTNKDLAFDYLRDRVALGNAGGAAHVALDRLRGGRARSTGVVLRGLHFGIVDEADSVFIDEARTPLILSASKGDANDAEICNQALLFAHALEEGRHYAIDRRERIVDLREAGKEELAQWAEAHDGAWASKRVREELVRQALSALALFHRDQHYVVNEDKVQIVDEFTGRIMADRSWERGLHQMIEAKEGVELTTRRDTLARITYQRLFRRYLRLAGMTGTGKEVAPEIWSIYRLDFVRVPLNRPSRRSRLRGHLFVSAAQKWDAVAERAAACVKQGRPVLIGTRSVRASEELSRVLGAHGLEHALLNAKQDKEEADIVARAGEARRITLATNIAGRGTDIRLPQDVVARGGLHVILTECHESARIDRQLFGRCARQGDPGSCAMLVSLDDELFRIYAPWLTRLARNALPPAWRSAALLWALRVVAQSAAERRNAHIRADNLKLDRRLEKTLAFSGQRE